MKINLYLLFLLVSICLNGQIVLVQPLSISDENSCMGPAFYGEGIVFSTNKKHSLTKTFIDNKTGEVKYLYDLYSATFKDSIKSQIKITPFSDVLNSALQEGACTFYDDSKKIVFTRTNPIENLRNKDKKTLGLYFSSVENGVWSTPVPFPYNSKEYNLAHPFLSLNGKMLYFTSDKKGGFGGKDIWSSFLVNGTWSEPQNLGGGVNTKYNELYPFYESEEILYFSSNRKGTKGGYDIFKTDDINNPNAVSALDSPINSSFNDYGFIARNNTREGFFTSDRNGSNDQIFSFSISHMKFDTCDESRLPKMCFTFSEEEIYSEKPPVKFQWEFGDGTIGEGKRVKHCYKESGNYKINLNYIDTLTKELYKKVGEYALEVEDYKHPYIKVSDTVSPNKAIFLNCEKTDLVPWADDFYWYIDDNKIYHEKDISSHLSGVGKHHIVFGYTHTDNDNLVKQGCTYKNIIVPLDKKRLESEKQLDFVFLEDEQSLNVLQKDAFEYLIDSVFNKKYEFIHVRINDAFVNKELKENITKQLTEIVHEKGLKESTLYIESTALVGESQPITSYASQKIKITLDQIH